MNIMDFPDIIYEKSYPLALIYLNRPETKNVFTEDMMDSLRKALKNAKADDDIKVIVLGGKGGAFCAGGNIKDMANGKLSSWGMKNYLWEKVQRVTLLMEDIDKPIIASIDGPAYGGGFDLTLACDLRIVSERAIFCSSFARIGLAPGNGGAYFLPRLIGFSKAMEILFTARDVNADEALRIGLADRVVPADKLQEETTRYGMEIGSQPLGALRAIKRAVYNGQKSDLRAHLDYMSSQLGLLTQTEAHKEAVNKILQGAHS
jgi:enoyl-CoA hydratase/carnithine racemase